MPWAQQLRPEVLNKSLARDGVIIKSMGTSPRPGDGFNFPGGISSVLGKGGYLIDCKVLIDRKK